MGAHWAKKAREHGYDPEQFTDATEGEFITAIVGLKHLKGATIGDGENCSGSRCLKDIAGVEWTYVGATMAWVAFADGRRRRYMVNGIPSGQDRTMNMAGEEIRLRPPTKTKVKGYDRARNKKKSRGGGANKKGTGELKKRERGIAAVMRNTDLEVSA